MMKKSSMAALAALGLALTAGADEKHFAFVNEPKVPNENELEFEQWITGRFGRNEGSYARWDIAEELEYGFTDKLGGALYLKFTDIHEGTEDAEDDGLDFTGAAVELKYSFSDPYSDALGSQLYLEFTTDGASHEIEEKFILGKEWDNWTIAFNTIIEQEWADEDGETEKESALEFGAGISRKLGKEWSAGIEAVHKHGFLGLDLDEEEYSTTSIGPNVHFKRGNFHMTFAVLPQIAGTGDGADDGLQLEHAEHLQTRLNASLEF